MLAGFAVCRFSPRNINSTQAPAGHHSTRRSTRITSPRSPMTVTGCDASRSAVRDVAGTRVMSSLTGRLQPVSDTVSIQRRSSSFLTAMRSPRKPADGTSENWLIEKAARRSTRRLFSLLGIVWILEHAHPGQRSVRAHIQRTNAFGIGRSPLTPNGRIRVPPVERSVYQVPLDGRKIVASYLPSPS